MKQVVFLFCLISSPAVQAETLTGTARNSKGEAIYRELHEITKDEAGYAKFIKVEYRKPDGQLFAKMSSDFSKNKLLPETVFEDFRFQTKQTLRLQDKSIEIEEFKDEVKKSSNTIQVNGLQVASQGFDNFIRMYRSKIEKEPQDFKFGILSRAEFYSLAAYERVSKDKNDIEFGVHVSSRLLRPFVKELRVVYESGDMHLKSFIGTSNILDDKGNSQDVRIDYEWQGEP